jgi:hypothetical protein
MEIVRTAEYDEQIEELTNGYSRMDDLDSAIDWALSRDPTKIPSSINFEGNYYLWVTEEFSSMDIPKVRIVYSYDGIYTVSLISIERY